MYGSKQPRSPVNRSTPLRLPTLKSPDNEATLPDSNSSPSIPVKGKSTSASTSTPAPSKINRWNTDRPASKVLFQASTSGSPETREQQGARGHPATVELLYVIQELEKFMKSLQYTKRKLLRKNVSHRKCGDFINALKNLLLNSGIQPKPVYDADRSSDPHWYIDTFFLLSKHVSGTEGVKHLVETIVIIKSLLCKISKLECKVNVLVADVQELQKLANVDLDDSSSLVSRELHSDLLEKLINGGDLGGSRREVLSLVRIYLETFLVSNGCSICYSKPTMCIEATATLTQAAYKYHMKVNSGDDVKWTALFNIIKAGNESNHMEWWTEKDKDTLITDVHNAIETLPKFKQYLCKTAEQLKEESQ